MKTKNLFLAIVMSFTTLSAALAQDADFGIKAGLNYSTLSGNDIGETAYLLGYHVGLTAEYQFSPQFAIQPELIYSLEGAESSFEMEIEDFFISSEQKIKLGYINLPVMAKFYVGEGFNLQAGPQVGYLVSAKSDYEISSNFEDFDMNESGTEDIKDDLKKLSFGLNFGLGYDLNENLFLQARYHVGLTDISDFEIDPDDEMGLEFDKIKNSGVQVSVGYKF